MNPDPYAAGRIGSFVSIPIIESRFLAKGQVIYDPGQPGISTSRIFVWDALRFALRLEMTAWINERVDELRHKLGISTRCPRCERWNAGDPWYCPQCGKETTATPHDSGVPGDSIGVLR